MSGDFLDSSIFVCLFDETDERKRGIAGRIVESALQTGSASISFQVVQETLNVVTRKLVTPMTAEGAKSFMQDVLGAVVAGLAKFGAVQSGARRSETLPVQLL